MLEARRVADRETLYERYVNPQWVRLLDVLQMNVEYASCVGAELHRADGRRILDFISGYCVHNVGHNHPRVITALKDELDRNGPAMLQSHVSDLAGDLAARLCQRAGGRLSKAFFDSSGSEGIETVLKFARAHTSRPGILYADSSFHGLTCGALSLMSNPF
jgi:ornithine--oxo-acid transaminase